MRSSWWWRWRFLFANRYRWFGSGSWYYWWSLIWQRWWNLEWIDIFRFFFYFLDRFTSTLTHPQSVLISKKKFDNTVIEICGSTIAGTSDKGLKMLILLFLNTKKTCTTKKKLLIKHKTSQHAMLAGNINATKSKYMHAKYLLYLKVNHHSHLYEKEYLVKSESSLHQNLKRASKFWKITVVSGISVLA